MAEFSYKAITADGATVTDTIEAVDRYALARKLKTEGKTLVSAEVISVGGAQKSWYRRLNDMFMRVKVREQIIFARNLSAMVKAGLPLSRALSVMGRQSKNKLFKEILTQVEASVQKGLSLSAALAEYPKAFPKLFVAMVRAGEESGRLAEALGNLSTQLDKAYQLKRRVRGAMIYPSIVISVMVLVGIAMLVFVVPTLTSTFEELGVELPLSTRVIVGMSDVIQNNTILFVLGLGALIFGGVIAFRTSRGKRFFESLFLHTPVIGEMVKETNAARTARTLSSLLTSGVEVVNALSITRDVLQNSFYKEVIAEAEERIQRGDPISEIFIAHENLYPVLVGEMISVGEEAGNLPEMLNNVAEFYESEVEEKTKNLSTIIEPVLMVIIGVVVGFFALSMITPIYSISSGI